jgi:hypothetical protein
MICYHNYSNKEATMSLNDESFLQDMSVITMTSSVECFNHLLQQQEILKDRTSIESELLNISFTALVFILIFFESFTSTS